MKLKQSNLEVMEQVDYINAALKKFPKPLVNEVVDFVKYLEAKQKKEASALLQMSSTSLEKDWESPEEDAAWADL